MKIGDLFYQLFIQDKGLNAEAARAGAAAGVSAGDAAGKTMGERMSTTLKTSLGVGAKVAGAVLAGGLAIATKGMLELQNVTADFAAETGASAEEADRAGKAINRMAGRNIQPLAEVGRALTKVHTDLGLTGDEAEAVTERFLKFARVTKRDAAQEVSSFDDILDAWNLTADAAGGIMDALIVSHQQYGGVIADDEAALRDLAPVLKAANQTWEDGLGLINLFKDSGLDASVAVAGITKALAKVKSPEQLQRLIADIAATEDPFLRAQKAAELFGAKAGPKLANVLKPGMKGLDQYRISTEEAAGATQKAADVLDSTWGARFQLLLKGAGAALIDFGDQFGPALTGIASLASLVGPTLLKPLAAALLEAGKKGGEALSDGLSSVWAGAGGTVLGNNIATRLENILDPTKSTLIGNAYRNAADKAGTLYLKSLMAGDAIGGALQTAWRATGGRALAAAGIQGAAAGRAFALAASAAIIAAPVVTILVALQIADDVRGAKATFASQVEGLIKSSTRQGLESAKAAIQAQIESQKVLGIIPIQFAGEVDAMTGQIERIDAAIAGLDSKAAAMAVGVTGPTRQASGSFVNVGDKAREMAATVLRGVNDIKAWVHGLASSLAAEARAMISGYYDPLILQDNLLATNAQIAAAKRVLASKTASDAEKADARATLHSLGATQSEYLIQLAEAGKLGTKAGREGLAQLRESIKKAKGPAKAALQEILDKILEVERAGKTVPVNVVIRSQGDINYRNRATGGPVTAGQLYRVNEDTPRSEFFVPDVSGRILTHAQGMEAAAGGGGDTYNMPLSITGLPMQVESPADVVREIRRASRLGLAPARRVQRFGSA